LYICYAQELENNLYLGVNLKGYNVYSTDATDTGAWGFGSDIGARYVLMDMIAIGITVVDPIAAVRWHTADGNIWQNLSPYSPNLRYGLSFTSKKQNAEKQGTYLNIGIGFDQDLISNHINGFFGGEVSIPLAKEKDFLQRVAFRAGFNNTRLTVGGGLKTAFTEINYAHLLDELDSDGSHLISTNFTF
jgi:hypothetical protein